MGLQAVFSPSKIIFSPAWQTEYQAAVLELDQTKLLQRIHLAEAAIFNRLQQLGQKSDGKDHALEKQAIADAVDTLRVLKRDKLGFPDWGRR